MAQAPALGLELLGLRRVGLGRVDLGELELQQVEIALAHPLAGAELGQLAVEALDLRVGGAVGVATLELCAAREAVEDLELRRGEHQAPVLVLAVEGQEPSAERLQVGGRRRATADEGAGSSRGADPPSEHDLLGAVGQALGDRGELRVVQEARRQREDALHPCLRGARTDDLRASLAAEEQVERVREHGLPGPGLAGDRVQPGAEAQLGALDQEQVLDPQLEQHRPLVAAPPDGFAPESRCERVTRAPARPRTPYVPASRPNLSRIRR